MEKPTVEQPFSIAILAGGHSKRMGQNKALMDLGGRTVIQHLIQILEPLSNDLFLVANVLNDYQHLGPPIVTDIIPDKAALGGIYTALKQAKYAWVFVCACDMPFVDAQVIKYLARQIDDSLDIICPLNQAQYPEPLHSLYHKQCAALVEHHVQENRLKVAQLFNHLVVQQIAYEALAAVTRSNHFFLNLNTPADFAKAQTLVGDQDKPNPT